jgi:hypothetical protein
VKQIILVVVGTYYYCSTGAVLSTTVYSNSNPCYTGANTYYDAVHGATSTNYSNSYPNTSPNWVNSSTTCVGYDLYNVQTDINQCSSSYGTTQLGSVNTYNSPTCGYLDPVTCDISAVCTGTTQTITLNNFAGGNGTYYANSTTYDNPVSAQAAGASTLVSGSIIYYGQPSGSRYVYVTSGYRNVMKDGGNTCTTTTTAAPTTTTTTAASPTYSVGTVGKYQLGLLVDIANIPSSSTTINIVDAISTGGSNVVPGVAKYIFVSVTYII